MAVHTFDFTAKVPGSPFTAGGTESRIRLLGLVTNPLNRITLDLNAAEEEAIDQYQEFYKSLGYEQTS